jgi:hypothetical protein
MSAKTVRTNIASGAITGFTRDGVHRWRAIPYAKPPVGALRFKAPEPVNVRCLLSVLLWMVGSVDPRDFRDLRPFGRFADEPFRVFGAGGVEYAGTLVADCLGQTVVDVGGGMQAQPAVAMFIVIPTEVDLAVQSSFLDRAEPAGEVGPVLQRLELGLAERVVVGDVRSRM